jgi:hypothetical protein
MKVKHEKEKEDISELPAEIYIKPNSILSNERIKKEKKRINLLSIPKKIISNSTCVIADVLTKKEIIPKLSKEIEYLMGIQESEHLNTKNEFLLKPIRNITNNDYYYKKYHPVALNLLIDNVLKNQQYKKSDLMSKDYDVLKHKIKNQKIFQPDNQLFQEIVKDGREKKDQVIFENFIKLKTLEEKYNTVLKKSIKDIENWDTVN